MTRILSSDVGEEIQKTLQRSQTSGALTPPRQKLLISAQLASLAWRLSRTHRIRGGGERRDTDIKQRLVYSPRYRIAVGAGDGGHDAQTLYHAMTHSETKRLNTHSHVAVDY